MATLAEIALTRMRSKLQCKGSIIELMKTNKVGKNSFILESVVWHGVLDFTGNPSSVIANGTA